MEKVKKENSSYFSMQIVINQNLIIFRPTQFQLIFEGLGICLTLAAQKDLVIHFTDKTIFDEGSIHRFSRSHPIG